MAYGSALPASVDSHDARKARGAFFTPPEIANYITGRIITDANSYVLEPACGEAEFLISAASRLHMLGCTDDEVNRQLVGNELDRRTTDAARDRLATRSLHPTIVTGDFFDMEPEPRFSAVVGNPPYIRYQQFTGNKRARARERALAAGVRLDALSSSWAPFVIHAMQFLRAGGNLGFVLPAELLTSNYAAPVRRYLLDSFEDVSVTLFENPVFPEVQEEVVLLCAFGFGQGPTDCLRMAQVYSVQELGSSRGFAATVGRDGRWPVGIAAQDARFLLANYADKGLTPLSAYGDIRLGAVTGANNYFALTQEDVHAWGLSKSDVVRLCPPGSHHLRSLALSNDKLEALTRAGKRTFLFSPEVEPSSAAQQYIHHGENLGINVGYKCRKRSPWWRVPGLRVCDIFITYMNGYGPSLCANDAGVTYLNSVHGLFLGSQVMPQVRDLLPLSAQSTVTLLSAELVGRSYGGGILKLEPREASSMLVPSQGLLLECADDLEAIRGRMETCLATGRRDEATLLVDEAILPHLGISTKESQRLHGLLLELRARRDRRQKAGGARS